MLLEVTIVSIFIDIVFCVTVVTETTGSVSGRSITSELNDELNDLIQRFHNQLHDSQVHTHAHIAKQPDFYL